MKKYLMTGIAAIAMVATFTSCTSHDFEPMTEGEIAQAKYDQAFLKYIGGTIDKNQDWGFSATSNFARTRAQNTNSNEWADVSNSTGFGGWLVPDPLTEGQKLRVKAYFQANPNLTFEDPKLENFFVQQVYSGASAAGANSTEVVTAADGSTYTSANMNLLTVGKANVHINNFNHGDATELDVLDNGANISTHTGETYHKDKIMLMVDIDDTSCFGYHETGSSNEESTVNHNDKAALVAASVIDAWAAQNGNIGEAVTDKWNRSFLGFDLAIKEGAAAYEKDDAGNIQYATYAQAPESPAYAWDGSKVIPIKEISYVEHNESWGSYTETVYGDYLDAYKTIQNIGWLTTNENFYVAADKVTLDQTYQNGETQASTLTDVKNAVVIKDLVYDGTKYQAVINLQKINQLVADGYLPINNKSLTEWVKVGKSDGYFSDWIVTLTPGQKAPQPEEEVYDLKIIAEDLSAGEDGDFDFNDIVLEVKYGSPAKVKLTHAGGTLPLCINLKEEWETHKLFGVGEKTMVNTGAGPNKAPVVIEDFNESIANAAEANTKIRLYVKKGEEWKEMTAPKGEPACKLAVGIDFKVLGERTSIKQEYPLFVEWATGTDFTSKWWTTE